MELLEIVKYPNPTLRENCQEISSIDDQIRSLLNKMANTMYDAPGVGLAAPQIGENIRAIVIDVGIDDGANNKLYKLINPKIINQTGEVDSDEGCLSIPGITGVIKRAESVIVSALDENGEELTIEAGGLLSVCLQHEIDHLNGILFIDHMSKLKREMIKKKLKRLEDDFGK